MKRSKTYRSVAEKVDHTKLYTPTEAMEFAKANGAPSEPSDTDAKLPMHR